MTKYLGIGANELDTYLDYAIFSIIAIYTLHAAPSEMGLLGACFAFPFLFSSRLFGNIFDNTDIRKWRTVLFVINLIAMPCIIMQDNIVILYMVAIIKTTARCGINISNTKLNKDDNESQKFYEIYGYLINISRIVIPLIVSLINYMAGTWAVLILSITLNMIGALCAFTDPSYQRELKTTSDMTGGVSYSFYRSLRKNNDLLILVMAYTLANLAFFLSNDMLSIFFQTIGQKESSIGFIISLLGCGGLVGTKLASTLINKVKARYILFISMFVNIIAFACFGYLNTASTSTVIFYTAILFVGAASGITFFAIRYGVRNAVDFEHMGKATGSIQMLSAIVAIIMPVVGGFLADYFSIAITFQTTAVMLSVTLLYFVIKIKWNNREANYMYNPNKLSDINFIADKHYELYQKGKSKQLWDSMLDWELASHDNIPEHLHDTAVTVASLSAHVEMLGMENAAELLLQAEDFALKIGLAQAVNDEARHSELFAKYAILAQGSIKDLSRTRDLYVEHFTELKTFDEIFLSHVFLENGALEQFNIFIHAFGDQSLIGQIYKGAMHDEARHVQMGITYFRTLIEKSPAKAEMVKNHLSTFKRILHVNKEGVEWLADISKIPAEEIERRIKNRHDNFITKIMGAR